MATFDDLTVLQSELSEAREVCANCCCCFSSFGGASVSLEAVLDICLCVERLSSTHLGCELALELTCSKWKSGQSTCSVDAVPRSIRQPSPSLASPLAVSPQLEPTIIVDSNQPEIQLRTHSLPFEPGLRASKQSCKIARVYSRAYSSLMGSTSASE